MLIAFIVLIVVVTTVSLAIVLNREQGPTNLPNILVVIADDLGYNDVGYQGHGDIKTPYIDSLARYCHSVTFVWIAMPRNIKYVAKLNKF